MPKKVTNLDYQPDIALGEDSSANTEYCDVYILRCKNSWKKSSLASGREKNTRDAIGLLRSIGEIYLEKNKEVISSVTVAAAFRILVFSSSKSRDKSGTNTRSFSYPHRKKSHEVISGDLGGHVMKHLSLTPARPIQRSDISVFSTHYDRVPASTQTRVSVRKMRFYVVSDGTYPWTVTSGYCVNVLKRIQEFLNKLQYKFPASANRCYYRCCRNSSTAYFDHLNSLVCCIEHNRNARKRWGA
ncbi:hypothetical protein ANN_25784 [Periplaneta americana]|uniref:Uncharacterized protein n=1 Tax=Periplaneta americana TaxID=6978 RepID=A0ABQ8S4J7_PERAM|nr:hypothetical protein ANN_25784 [Periplaneta americana]